MGNRITILAMRLALWGVVVPIAIPIVLAGTFLFAARWVIYFFAAVVLTAYALGSKQHMHYFWLAFLIPFFVGGLLEGIGQMVAERWSARIPSDRLD